MPNTNKNNTKPSSSTGTSKNKRKPGRRGTQYVTKRELTGYKYSPAAEIPEFTLRPWYPCTVSYTGAPFECTIALLVGYLVDQLDKERKTFKDTSASTNKGVEFELRFRSVEVWNLTGRAISLSVWEPPSTDYSSEPPGYTYNQLGGWTDAGGSDSFPRLGYVYPQHIQQYVHKADWTSQGTPFKVTTTTASSDKDTLLHRFHIYWRPPGVVLYTSVIPHPPATQDIISSVTTVSSGVASSSATAHQDSEVSTAKLAEVSSKVEVLTAANAKLLNAIKRVCEAINKKIPSTTEEDDLSNLLRDFVVADDHASEL